MTILHQIIDRQQVEITIPKGARAVIVAPDYEGGFVQRPVSERASVLDIERDLISHITEIPYSTEWLEELQSYIKARLRARQEAELSGSAIHQSADHEWHVVCAKCKSEVRS